MQLQFINLVVFFVTYKTIHYLNSRPLNSSLVLPPLVSFFVHFFAVISEDRLFCSYPNLNLKIKIVCPVLLAVS